LRTGGQRWRSVQTNKTNNLVFIKHHHQLHIGKNVSDELSILLEDGTATLTLLCVDFSDFLGAGIDFFLDCPQLLDDASNIQTRARF
jgi:hypothetical protein